MIPRVIALLAFAALAGFGLHETRAAGEIDTEAAETAAGAAPAPDPDPDPAAGTPDVERYCELSDELARAADEFFREQRDTGPREAKRAGREFVREQSPAFAEIKQVAPGAIRDDVITFVQGSRAFLLGTESGPSPAQARGAERRLAAFDRKSCDT